MVSPEAELDLQRTPAKNRDLATWIRPGHRSSPELPSTSNSISTFVIAKSLWSPPAGKRLAQSSKQNRHKLEAQGLTCMQEKQRSQQNTEENDNTE